MNRPWIVRTVALLLVLVSLQAGAFRDLEADYEWCFGTAESSAAVVCEARKADPAIAEPPAGAVPPRAAPALAVDAVGTVLNARGACATRAFRPSPTGPPRA